jgi:hypothetical protein
VSLLLNYLYIIVSYFYARLRVKLNSFISATAASHRYSNSTSVRSATQQLKSFLKDTSKAVEAIQTSSSETDPFEGEYAFAKQRIGRTPV